MFRNEFGNNKGQKGPCPWHYHGNKLRPSSYKQILESMHHNYLLKTQSQNYTSQKSIGWWNLITCILVVPVQQLFDKPVSLELLMFYMFLPGPRYDTFSSQLSVMRCGVIKRHHVLNVFNHRVTRRWHDYLTITHKKEQRPRMSMLLLFAHHSSSISCLYPNCEL